MEVIALTSWTAALLVVITVVFRYLIKKND
jgi:hypothetical protein